MITWESWRERMRAQAILGHKSLRTTELYMHVTQPGVDRLQEVLARSRLDL